MSNYLNAMEICKKCGQPKIAVNEQQKCLKCDREPGTSTLVVTCDDPGEEKIAQVLAKAGVRIPATDKTAKVPAVTKTEVVAVSLPASGAPFEACVQSALKILQGVPMPKDIKQFKALAKVIKSLEILVGVTHE